MKKRLLAILCALTLLAGTVPAASALAGEAERAADTLAALSLVKGDGSGNYALDMPATRAHAAVLLVRLAGKESAARQSAAPVPFGDVPAWCAKEVGYAASRGWIAGTTAATFSPNDIITANAWCTMLLRLLGYSDQRGDFEPSSASVFALRIGLTTRMYSDDLTRGDLFQIMKEALTFPCKDGSGTLVEKLAAAGVCSRSTVNALGLLDPELTARQIADRHMAAVFTLDLYEDADTAAAGEPDVSASGFFISADGLAVTCYHCIDGMEAATVTLVTGETYPVESVITYDPEIDMAVIRVSPAAAFGQDTSAFAYLDVVGTEDLRMGDVVYALSNPLGTGLAISDGIVSATEREVERYAQPCVLNTASISQGSSGGALLNAYGQVVAITSGAYTYGNETYLAVPANPVLEADLTVPGMTLKEVAQLEAGRADK